MTPSPDTPTSNEPDSFLELLGLEDVTSGEGWAQVRMPIRRRHLQNVGNVQGGIIVAVADMALARAIQTLLAPEQSTVTVELKVNFIAPARDGVLTGEGRIIFKGGTLAVGEATITNDQGVLVAKCLGTWMMMSPRR